MVFLTEGDSHFLCSFGSKLRSTKLGIIYNDNLWDAINLWVNEFNLEADTMKPRKRPMSLASPSIVLDKAGNVRMVIGAAGGKYIATALAQASITTIYLQQSRFICYFNKSHITVHFQGLFALKQRISSSPKHDTVPKVNDLFLCKEPPKTYCIMGIGK